MSPVVLITWTGSPSYGVQCCGAGAELFFGGSRGVKLSTQPRPPGSYFLIKAFLLEFFFTETVADLIFMKLGTFYIPNLSFYSP